MATKPLPTSEVLRQLLTYEPETGKLFWKERGPEWFSSLRSCKSWNTQFAQKEAFGFICDKGYHVSVLLRRRYSAHRVIWKLVHGIEPDDIDHINGDRTDNRLENLRNVSRLVNTRNQKLPSNNTHGHLGVYSVGSKWRAQIRVRGALKDLGRFAHFNDAVAARKAAEMRYGFHPNHGRQS